MDVICGRAVIYGLKSPSLHSLIVVIGDNKGKIPFLPGDSEGTTCDRMTCFNTLVFSFTEDLHAARAV